MNYNHVRNAFLNLDADSDGYITAEDLAKFVKNTKITSSKTGFSKNINFT